MKRLALWAAGAALLWSAVAVAEASSFVKDDPGAGWIPQRPTPCLIANRTHQGPACPEPPLMANGDKAARVANRLARAHWFIDMEELDKARTEADAAATMDGDSRDARLLAARLALSTSDIATAERELDILRKQAPDDVNINATYATLLVAKGADDEALREFHKIIFYHPDHLYAREQRARILIRRCRCDAALPDLNAILEVRPNDPVAHDLRAQALQAIGHNLPAVADLNAAIAAEPNNFLRVIDRADAYAKAELDALALQDYDKVLSMTDGVPLYVMFDDMRAKLLVKRALVLVHLHRFERAADDVLMAIHMGGVPARLRAQIMLRRHGFGDVPLDGKDSAALRQGMSACFGLNACFQGIMRAI